MSRVVVRLLCLPAALLVGIGLATADPTALAGAEPATEADVLAAAADPELEATNRELTARLEAVAVRSGLKEDLTDQLLTGRAGLVAAADGFLDANRAAPGCVANMRLHFPAASEQESAARNVIEYARQRAAPRDWPALARRLAGEYRAAFGHNPNL